ncbi:DNA mismatch repair protein [Aspergillus luchuensis]|uniref:DNA mismatch repair protein n=1 Tax=Aspergillus kawachii TaxID=1069201 RepID=A0A146FNX6_ASPKA|nr:DNA mismatch repair protein [Aspergillus luchuensis]
MDMAWRLEGGSFQCLTEESETPGVEPVTASRVTVCNTAAGLCTRLSGNGTVEVVEVTSEGEPIRRLPAIRALICRTTSTARPRVFLREEENGRSKPVPNTNSPGDRPGRLHPPGSVMTTRPSALGAKHQREEKKPRCADEGGLTQPNQASLACM